MWFQAKLLSFYSNLCRTYEISQNPPWKNSFLDFSLGREQICTLLVGPVPTVCSTLSGTKYSPRSDFVARVTLRVALDLYLEALLSRPGSPVGSTNIAITAVTHFDFNRGEWEDCSYWKLLEFGSSWVVLIGLEELSTNFWRLDLRGDTSVHTSIHKADPHPQALLSVSTPLWSSLTQVDPFS